jgi:hypothetical protein
MILGDLEKIKPLMEKLEPKMKNMMRFKNYEALK